MNDGDLYLWYGRVLKQKDVDRELKKIGSWREKISSDTITKIVILAVVLSLVGGVFIVDKKQRAAKEQFRQELSRDLAQNPNNHDSVYMEYFNKALEKQY